MIPNRRALVLVLAAAGSAACLGRVERAQPITTLPYHAPASVFEELPDPTPVEKPSFTTPLQVRFSPLVAYYPLPTGLAVGDSALASAYQFDPVVVAPAPELAIRSAFESAIKAGAGEGRVVQGVVTDFQWYMLGFRKNAGRVATTMTIQDPSGKVVFSGQRVTTLRGIEVDDLLHAHVRDWLSDTAFASALKGGAP